MSPTDPTVAARLRALADEIDPPVQGDPERILTELREMLRERTEPAATIPAPGEPPQRMQGLRRIAEPITPCCVPHIQEHADTGAHCRLHRCIPVSPEPTKAQPAKVARRWVVVECPDSERDGRIFGGAGTGLPIKTIRELESLTDAKVERLRQVYGDAYEVAVDEDPVLAGIRAVIEAREGR